MLHSGLFKKGHIPWNKGIPLSEDICKKISISRTGQKVWNNGIPHTEETKKKISIAKLGKCGVLANSWKGGVSKDRKYQNHKNRLRRHSRGINKRNISKYGGIRISKKHYRTRRKKLENCAGILTENMVKFVYEENIKKHGYLKCCLCQLTIDKGDETLEHLLPLARGGKNNIENLSVAHRICNSKKGKKTFDEYKEYLNGDKFKRRSNGYV